MAFNRLSSIYRFLDGRFYCPSNSGGAGSCVGPGAAGSGAAGGRGGGGGNDGVLQSLVIQKDCSMLACQYVNMVLCIFDDTW